MDYNQLKVSSSYRRAAGPHVHRARTIVLQDRTCTELVPSCCRTARALGSYRRAAGPHELAVCCVSLLYRVLLKGVLYACC